MNLGGMLEWPNRLVSKTMRGESLTGVQIPLPPPRNKLLSNLNVAEAFQFTK